MAEKDGPKVAEIRLNVSDERLNLLTVDDMIAVENVGEGKVSTKALKAILAKFVANEHGEYLDEKEALSVLGKLTRPQFIQVAREFFAGVNGLAVNPTTDSS